MLLVTSTRVEISNPHVDIWQHEMSMFSQRSRRKLYFFPETKNYVWQQLHSWVNKSHTNRATLVCDLPRGRIFKELFNEGHYKVENTLNSIFSIFLCFQKLVENQEMDLKWSKYAKLFCTFTPTNCNFPLWNCPTSTFKRCVRIQNLWMCMIYVKTDAFWTFLRETSSFCSGDFNAP